MKKRSSHVLIIGSGISGLAAAILAEKQGYEVTLVTKAEKIENSNSSWAQGGVSYQGIDDNSDLLAKDLNTAAAGMANPETVTFFSKQGPKILKEVLLDLIKVPFDKSGETYHLTEEAAHSKKRILFSDDNTGKVIVKSLIEYIKNYSQIKILRNHIAVDIITIPHHSKDALAVYFQNSCLGAYLLNNKNGRVRPVFANRTILATGGIGQIFKHNTNPQVATGDGIALAYRAGARIVNLEYTQFHPTTLAVKGGNNFLISEAVRGEGGILINEWGQDFSGKYHPKASLAPRDIVSRAIISELNENGGDCVYLDLHKIPTDVIQKRFPNILKECLKQKINILKEPIPVLPAFHFSCGGVLTNIKGKTSLPNLFAIGEIACTGLHGANRLASTSLLECIVMAKQATESIDENFDLNKYKNKIHPWADGAENELDPILIKQDWETLKSTMWNYVGIIRKEKRMVRALNDMTEQKKEVDQFYRDAKVNLQILELRNAIQTGILVTRAALKNKKSTGCHYRVD